MEITQTPKEPLIETIAITLEVADYKEAYEKSLKDYRKRVQLPGFRPGTVPVSLVRKRFGPSILGEQVNQQVSKALTEYIQEKEATFLARPFLTETSFEELPAAADQDLVFTFEVGLQPEFELNIEGLPTIDTYHVEITETDIDRQIERYRYQHSHGEEVQHLELGQEYLVHGILSTAPKPKLAATPDAPEEVEYDYRRSYSVFTALVPGIKPVVLGKGVGESVSFVPKEVFADDQEGASELRVPAAEYSVLKDQTLTYAIKAARHTPQHPLNEEFYGHLFPEDTPTDEAAFKQRVKEKLEIEAEQLAQLYLNFRLKSELLKRHTFDLPDRVLQAFFYEELTQNKDQQQQLDANSFAQQYAQYREEMRLHLIRQKLSEKYPKVVLSDEDFQQTVRERLKGMFPPQPLVPQAELAGAENTAAEETAAMVTPAETAEAETTADMGAESDVTANAEDSPAAETPAENPMLDMLMNQVLSNPQFAEREFQNAQNARFYEVLQQEIFQTAEKKTSYTEFEQVITAAGY